MQEYYKILGLTEDATDEEIEIAYSTLKEKYMKERFLEGEDGNFAAKRLTKIENAYQEIKTFRSEHSTSGESVSLADVDLAIRNGNLNEAQEKLDAISTRDAEWHYLQSVIFYKKNWLNESKKQLEIAMNMEPQNNKYSEAYTKLRAKTEFNQPRYQSGNYNQNANNQGQHAEYQDRQMGGSGISDCISCCATWCCMDMMCSMCCR